MSSEPDPTRSDADSTSPLFSASTESLRVLVAPDSFKGTLTAVEAAEAIGTGWRTHRPNDIVDLCPIADGGEGTLEALEVATRGRIECRSVTGPLGQPVNARWGWLADGRTAVIEMAEASGLHLVPLDARDPTRTTTFGTGELMKAAMEGGARKLLVAIGGSATCDAGTGMAQALGVVFRRADGSVVTEPMTGGLLREVDAVDSAIALPPVRVLCDVTNPLHGERGAARIYGPQKGATNEQAIELDGSLKRLASLLGERAESIAREPGAGAAGGLGFGLRFWCGATLERGIDLVLESVQFDKRLQDANLVITGEGRVDRSSLEGKAAYSVAQRASLSGVPTIAVVGQVGDELESGELRGVFRFVEATSGEPSTPADANAALRAAATRAAKRWSAPHVG